MSGTPSNQVMGHPLPMFPLGTVLFPYARIPLHVFEPRYRALTAHCLAGDRRFGIVLIERGAEVGGGDQRTGVGTRALISEAVETNDGRWLLLVEGEARLRIGQWLPEDPYPLALVEEWPDPAATVETALLHQAEQSVRRTRALLAESGTSSALSPDLLLDDDLDVAAWQLCAEAPLSSFDAQRLLCCAGTSARLTLLSELTGALERDLHRMLSGQ
jgi:uncharacterized protein